MLQRCCKHYGSLDALVKARDDFVYLSLLFFYAKGFEDLSLWPALKGVRQLLVKRPADYKYFLAVARRLQPLDQAFFEKYEQLDDIDVTQIPQISNNNQAGIGGQIPFDQLGIFRNANAADDWGNSVQLDNRTFLQQGGFQARQQGDHELSAQQYSHFLDDHSQHGDL